MNPESDDPWRVRIRTTEELQHSAMLIRRRLRELPDAQTRDLGEHLAAIIAELERRGETA